VLERTVLRNPWIPKELHGKPFPSIPQGIFLAHPAEEVMYGGAAGGGKSTAGLAGALQYVDVPGYNALILRRTFPMLNLPGGLIPMSQEWLSGRRVHGREADYNAGEHRWTFPSGATLSFGFLDNYADVFKYQSAQFQYIDFEELTQFQETMYLYMFSRLRRVESLPVPLRMRSQTNPGGIGHGWVKKRWNIVGHRGSHVVTEDGKLRVFIPAKLSDNPGLDKDQYRRQLARLDDVTRRQLEDGDWDVAQDDNVFDLAALLEMERHVVEGVDGMLTEVKA
jgi:hypothetical protein